MPLTAQNLVRLTRPESPRARLVCFPLAGGGAGAFSGWRRQVRSDVELMAVRLPSRENLFNHPPVVDLRVIGKSLGDILADTDDSVPVALFGYCAGAFAAFEVARRLTKRGRPPSFLAIGSQVAPQVSGGGPRLYDRPSRELREVLRSLGGTDPAVLDDDEAWLAVEPALRADYQAIETYTTEREPMIGCAVVALHGSGDDRVELSEVSAWAELTTGQFTLTFVGGGHLLLKSGGAEVLAELERHLVALAGLPGDARDI